MAKETKKGGVPASFAKRLKDAGKSWGAAKKAAAESTTAFPEFEDGRYMARLTQAKIGESNSGRLQMVFTWKFEDDPYEGQEKLDFQGLESEQNLEYLAKRLTQLGYELPDDLSDIADIAEDMAKTKPLCRIRLKTKGDFQNVYVDKVFDPSELEDEDEDEDEAESDGDVPEAEEEEEETPAPKKGKKAKAEPVEEEEESDEEESDEEESDEEESDDEVELTVGMTVTAETTKGEVTGEVLEILEDEGKARVKVGDKVLRIALDKISVSEDVPEEPKVKTKAKKK